MEFTLSPMAKGFLPYSLEQRILLPPDLRDWLPEGHLALVISDVVAALDLSELLLDHRSKDPRGRAGYHPAMMLTLLIYAYCIGKPSSRKIEKATYEDVAFRVISANQHPDHDAIADFRKRNVPAFSGLFAQVLLPCREAGLVKLGHVAIDGTKIQANASKHKAMSYERMDPAQKKLQDEIDALLAEAERVDAEEDVKHGKGKRGDELPQELARRETRLRKIQEAKERLEAEAKERASDKAAEVRAELERRAKNEIATGKKIGGPTPKTPDPQDAQPDAKAQKNFTDPDSRIMPDSAHKGAFVQGYNAQIAVDAVAQIIVALDVTQQTNDRKQLVPMAKKIVANCGQLAQNTSADNGYFSEQAVNDPQLSSTELLVPPGRERVSTSAPSTEPAPDAPAKEQMRYKLASPKGRALYKMRKAIVEPVFGQIKEARGFRRFSLRGLDQVHAEFSLIALTHNLLKLFRAGAPVRTRAA